MTSTARLLLTAAIALGSADASVSQELAQLSDGLTDDQTEALVGEAEQSGDIILLIEIDPREGSGVIPLDWVALLQPKGSSDDAPGTIRGESVPSVFQSL